jgi:TonB-linked SusC/RagA family outer membrane protein
MKHALKRISPWKGRILRFSRYFLAGMFFLIFQLGAFAQQRTVSGTVSGPDRSPLAGVTVMVKGSATGTITDADGKYSLSVPSSAQTLVFSFMGMETQEIALGSGNVYNVTLAQSLVGLEEVVVIGYGTQKAVNLTGSVSSVTSDRLEKKIVSQATQLLSGETTGITVTQISGQPGADGASLIVRGQGTFSGAGNSPLVLIDGVPGSMNSVNPNDIESITVLKDAASSAIYGSRAANGVILIKTKVGAKGVMKISYESYVGRQKPSELPDFVDSWVYAEMMNEARANMNQSPLYTQDDIDKFKSGKYPDTYPNKKHLKDLFNSGNGLQTKQNITFNGGTGDAAYLFSAGYLKQNGLMKRNSYDRYDLLLNVNAKLRNDIQLNVKLSGNQTQDKRPAAVPAPGTRTSDMSSIAGTAHHDNATVPGLKSDGTYGVVMGHAVAEARLASGGYGLTKGTNFGTNISLDWNILKSLKWTNRVSYQWSYSKNRLFGTNYSCDAVYSFGPSQSDVLIGTSRDFLYESLVDYDLVVGDHSIHVLAGFSNITNFYESLGGYRDQFPSNKLYLLSSANAINDSNSESESSWKLVSYFGRINYALKDRYLVEGNLRYDGSSRFSRGNRYGLFPSFSAGWRVSEEDFFQVSWVEDLKLRASWGILGNQQIGTYPYQKTLALGSKFVYGETEVVYPGIQLTTLPFENITWETTKVTNGGIDVKLFKGKLSLTANTYYKLTSNILYSLSVSQVLGMSVGEQNAGKVENRGWEFELVYKDTKGDFSYSISPNFSINHNEVMYLAGKTQDINRGLFIGQPLNSIYGYLTDGLFIDQADIDSYATQNYVAKPGFPRFRDISGPEGKPDGIVSAAYDRVVLGSSFPKHSYGMSITANYKGFDFYVNMQGQGGLIKLLTGDEKAFDNYGNIQQWHVDNRWTEENPDRWAKYPRLEMAYHASPWDVDLDYWTRNASFLRIKNLQVGYNIPVRSSFIDRMRVYVSGENLKSFDYFYEGWDPEMETLGRYAVTYYPIARIWSFGVNIQF